MSPGRDDRLDGDGDGLADGCDPEPQLPLGMAPVPAATFGMGDASGTGGPEERPVHTVEVSAFFMDRREVTRGLWQEVRAWAVANGYELGAGAGKGAEHPVQMVSWYDAVKWCNARSERLALTPLYRTAAGEVFRSGEVDLRNEDVLRGANGFGLPTEAEWEKAAHVREPNPTVCASLLTVRSWIGQTKGVGRAGELGSACEWARWVARSRLPVPARVSRTAPDVRL